MYICLCHERGEVSIRHETRLSCVIAMIPEMMLYLQSSWDTNTDR